MPILVGVGIPNVEIDEVTARDLNLNTGSKDCLGLHPKLLKKLSKLQKIGPAPVSKWWAKLSIWAGFVCFAIASIIWNIPYNSLITILSFALFVCIAPLFVYLAFLFLDNGQKEKPPMVFDLVKELLRYNQIHERQRQKLRITGNARDESKDMPYYYNLAGKAESQRSVLAEVKAVWEHEAEFALANASVKKGGTLLTRDPNYIPMEDETMVAMKLKLIFDMGVHITTVKKDSNVLPFIKPNQKKPH